MGSIKLSIHPLFFLLGIYQALTGRIAIFLICCVSALCHEIGHSIAAQNLGYKLNKIILMPFGAVVKGNVDGLKKKDEIKIALAGPLVNIGIAIIFIASWWICPELYAFTDVVVAINFSMAIINFIPAYPLDGGRILYAFLHQKFGEKRADRVCVVLGIVLSLIMITAFIVVSFRVVNISLLLFALFCLFGAISKDKGSKYVRIFSGLNQEILKRGVPYKRHAVSVKTSVKTIMLLLDENAVNEIVVFDGNKKVSSLSQEKIVKIVEKGEIYAPIGKYIGV